MEKRAYKRIPVSIKVRYLEWRFFKNLYAGTIKNISEKGMFIYTNHTLIPDSLIEICIPVVKKKIFGIPVRKENICIPAGLINIVRENTLSNGSLAGIGIELSHPPQQYLELLKSLKTEA